MVFLRSSPDLVTVPTRIGEGVPWFRVSSGEWYIVSNSDISNTVRNMTEIILLSDRNLHHIAQNLSGVLGSLRAILP